MAVVRTPGADRTDLPTFVRALRTLERYGRLAPAYAFHVVAYFIESAAHDPGRLAADADLRLIDQRLARLRDAFDGAEAPESEGPEAEWDRAFDRTHARLMRESGEDAMADLFLHDRGEYDRRYELGSL